MRRCYCPDDCNCRHPWRTNVCGCCEHDEKEETMVRFEVGRRYFCRSFGDYNCVWSFEVIKRSARFVTLREDDGTVRRVGVRVSAGVVEVCSPLGRYSLSPVLNASREVVTT